MLFIKDVFKGIGIGAGAILPGISSGVLCVIFGIYDKLVESVLGIFKDFKKNFLYLLPIVIGAFLGIILFGNILSFILYRFTLQTKYAFIGLILGCTPVLLKKVNSNNFFRLHYLIYTVISFIFGILTILLESALSNFSFGNFLVQTDCFSSASFIFLMIAGIFMSIGIVVPGVSSTVILMCFGVYTIYLEAVSVMNFYILIPLGLGVLIGGIIFLKLINYLLNNFYAQTFYSIIGFTLGSVLVLYEPLTFNLAGIVSIILLCIGFYIASLSEAKE